MASPLSGGKGTLASPRPRGEGTLVGATVELSPQLPFPSRGLGGVGNCWPVFATRGPLLQVDQRLQRANSMKAALMALVLLPLTAANAGAVALPSTGVVTDGVGVQIHVWQDDTQRDRIQAAGIKWIRDDLRWDAIESTAGQYNWNSAFWDPYDTLVSDGAARGIHMLYTLNGNPTGAQSPYGDTDVTSATWRQAFTNYAAAAAAHFAGTGAIFELWNEPDNWGIATERLHDPRQAGHSGHVRGESQLHDRGTRLLGGKLQLPDDLLSTGFAQPCRRGERTPVSNGQPRSGGEHLYGDSQADANVRRHNRANRVFGMGLLQRPGHAGAILCVHTTTARRLHGPGLLGQLQPGYSTLQLV